MANWGLLFSGVASSVEKSVDEIDEMTKHEVDGYKLLYHDY